MRYSIHKKYLILILSFGLVTIDACRKKYAATAEHMTEYGWVLYETNDYLNSNAWFNDAIVDDSDWKDAYNGLGWSYAKLMVLDSSILHFSTGLEKKQDKWSVTDTQSEILAGLTFAYNAKGNDAKAIEYGRAFLDSTVKPLQPGWVFSHDSLLNYLDLRVTLAASYFAKGKFDSTIIQVSVVLDSLNSKETAVKDTSLIGRKLMAKQLMDLQTLLFKK
jgi:tetratricopeptide (TPR) repeat protein|tara:strand:+ start:354 stop:1010 length:657 start_codon:yes stop_codon:yes gene_type:complete